MNNTHAAKANSYDLGRPDYPSEFFDYLYNEVGVTNNDIIADIGCGTGKITRHFLDRGNKVIAIEPDGDMLSIANKRLAGYPNFTSYQKSAEATGIESNAVNHIFCGNAYEWFDRTQVVPEFRRILNTGGKIILTNLGSGSNHSSEEHMAIINRYRKPVTRKPNTSPPFSPGTFQEKIFTYEIHQTVNEFLHGSLSASFSPSTLDDEYGPYCKALRGFFDKHKTDGNITGVMRLRCVIGSAENLNEN